MTPSRQTGVSRPRVGLFVTCIVDLFRPSVAYAALKLLRDAGCEVKVPRAQTCCGQPGYNSGLRADARAMAARVIDAFEGLDYVVVPSGSCAAMLKLHYPELFAGEATQAMRAQAFAEKVHELVSFLVDVLGVERTGARFEGSVAYHDACSGLRELGIKDQPRRLLEAVEGLELKEVEEAETCCGFGGTFSVKYPDISNAIAGRKTQCVRAAGVDCVLAGDLGCLMQLAGKLSREGAAPAVRHVAEVLAGMTQEPAIGAAED